MSAGSGGLHSNSIKVRDRTRRAGRAPIQRDSCTPWRLLLGTTRTANDGTKAPMSPSREQPGEGELDGAAFPASSALLLGTRPAEPRPRHPGKEEATLGHGETGIRLPVKMGSLGTRAYVPPLGAQAPTRNGGRWHRAATRGQKVQASLPAPRARCRAGGSRDETTAAAVHGKKHFLPSPAAFVFPGLLCWLRHSKEKHHSC